MRINFRIKIFNRTLFFMYAKTQTLKGITSKVKGSKDKHYVFWDLENCTLEQAQITLAKIQYKYKLGHIFIVSDLPNSYRAWCFTKVDFKTFLKILLDTDYVDYNFFYWTVYRGEATLRITQKQDRPLQKIIKVLETYYNPLPKTLGFTEYDTGIGKRNINIFKDIGDNTNG